MYFLMLRSDAFLMFSSRYLHKLNLNSVLEYEFGSVLGIITLDLFVFKAVERSRVEVCDLCFDRGGSNTCQSLTENP